MLFRWHSRVIDHRILPTHFQQINNLLARESPLLLSWLYTKHGTCIYFFPTDARNLTALIYRNIQMYYLNEFSARLPGLQSRNLHSQKYKFITDVTLVQGHIQYNFRTSHLKFGAQCSVKRIKSGRHDGYIIGACAVHVRC
jgi:hypothetical protein